MRILSSLLAFFLAVACFLSVVNTETSGKISAALPMAFDAEAPAALPQIPGAVPVAPSAPDTAPATSAAAMALFDLNSGVFLAQSNAEERRPMASTTKIMTGLVILERCSLDEVLTVPAEAVGVEGSSIYLYTGEKISVRTLLYALLLSSANDAAHVLALHAAGSIPAFAALMNEKAAELGLQNTQFQNPHGLPAEGHYTTAHDLALIAAAAMNNPTFREIVSTTRYSAPQEGTDATRLFLNHNRLLRTYDGAIGVKTGFTKSSGRCLVSAAERNGLCLIAVTLNDGNDWRDAAALFDWGFAHYAGFVSDGTPVEMPVVGGEKNCVSLLPETTLRLTLPANHGEIERTVYAPRFLYGGCEAGEKIGRVVYTCDGKEIAEIPLVAAEQVRPAQNSKSLWRRILHFFKR